MRLLWSPLRVAEFGEGVTTASGEWVFRQGASSSRQLSKVHEATATAASRKSSAHRPALPSTDFDFIILARQMHSKPEPGLIDEA